MCSIRILSISEVIAKTSFSKITKCSTPAKEADDSAILDFERAEEKYNQDLACYLRFVDPVDDRKFLDRDLWRNRLYGVQTNELDGTKQNREEIEKVKDYIAEGKVFM